MESDGNVRTPGSAAYFLVGSSRLPCAPNGSGQLTIPVGRPMSNQDVSGPSLIVQMTPTRSQTQDHHARSTVVRTANQPVTMHRFPVQINQTSANHVLSPNQHFKQIPVYQVKFALFFSCNTILLFQFGLLWYKCMFVCFLCIYLAKKYQFNTNGICSEKRFCFKPGGPTTITFQQTW